MSLFYPMDSLNTTLFFGKPILHVRFDEKIIEEPQSSNFFLSNVAYRNRNSFFFNFNFKSIYLTCLSLSVQLSSDLPKVNT